MVNDNPSVTPPSEAASVILNAVESENPQLRYIVGMDAHQILEARDTLPEREFLSMTRKQFSELADG